MALIQFVRKVESKETRFSRKRIALFSLIISLFLASVGVATDLELKDLQGNLQSLEDYKGKIVVLNFWATWCQPCRKEMPVFVKLQSEYEGRGVQFVAASTDDLDEKKAVENFAQKYKLNFPVWVGATLEQQAGFKLGTSLPATVILDQQGQGRFRIIGQAEESILRERLDWLLSDKSSPQPEELTLPPGLTPEHFKEHEAGEPEDEEEHQHEALAFGSEVPS